MASPPSVSPRSSLTEASSVAPPSGAEDTVPETSGAEVRKQSGKRKQTVKARKSYQPEGPQALTDEILSAFRFLNFFMKVLLRFPLSYRKNTEDGSAEFYYTEKSPLTIGFLVTGAILILILFFACINALSMLLNYPPQGAQPSRTKTGVNFTAEEVRVHELYLATRCIGPMLTIMTALVHVCVGTINFFLKRHFAAQSLTFWTQAAGLMQINLAQGVKKYFNIVLGTYLGIIGFLIILHCVNFIPISGGTPAIFAMLLGRAAYPYLFGLNAFFVFRIICNILFFYIMLCSKAYILLFLFNCKLLKNGFKVWNERLDTVLNGAEEDENKPTDETKSEKKDDKPKNQKRMGYLQLFQDHVCLLDMLDGTDRLFAYTIETYFGTQLVSIIFEIYYLYRSQAAKDEFIGARRLDGIYMLVFFAQALLILIVVAKSAADVGDTAIEGLEIIRKRGMMGKKTDEELYFLLSTYLSFNGHFDTALGGAKYFTLDNAFLVGIAVTIFSYFIILIQFTPPLSYNPKAVNHEGDYVVKWKLNEILGNFEGTFDFIPGLPAKFSEEE